MLIVIHGILNQLYSQPNNIMTELYKKCDNDSLFVMEFGTNIYEKVYVKEGDLLKPNEADIDSIIFYSSETVIGPIADRIFYNWYKIIKRDTFYEDKLENHGDFSIALEYVKLTALEDYNVNFIIDFPKSPDISVEALNSNSMGLLKIKSIGSLDEVNDLNCIVSEFKLPISISKMFTQKTAREGFFKGKIGGFAYESDLEIVNIEEDNSDSYYGRKFELQGINGRYITMGRVLLVDRTVYFITASSGRTKEKRQSLIDFVESFRLK